MIDSINLAQLKIISLKKMVENQIFAQYHLVEAGISLFNDIDIFLTFGEEKKF